MFNINSEPSAPQAHISEQWEGSLFVFYDSSLQINLPPPQLSDITETTGKDAAVQREKTSAQQNRAQREILQYLPDCLRMFRLQGN